MNRQGLGYGLLFAVPPAVGMTGFSVMATTGGLINPIAALIGVATFGIIFVFVYIAAARGQANENRSPGTI
jgi:multisubunit Na+/H+ antiporter MnhB subunit